MFKLSSFIITILFTNTFAKCFTTFDVTNSSKLFSYKGKVYDISGYSHPGGKSDLLKTVGEQLETYVNTNKYDFHLSSSKFKSDLKNMYVGDLADNCTTTETTETTETTILPTTESPPYNCIPFVFNPLSLTKSNITTGYNNANGIQTDTGVKLSLTQNGGTSIKINNEFQYGAVDAFFKVSNGVNVISSFYIESENKDQVIFNMVHNNGNSENAVIETNFFYQGNIVYDNNVKYHYPTELLSESYNKYTIVWFPDYYEWRFNDLILRRLNKNDTDIFPDDPSNIKFSIWEAGPSIWAGKSGIQWDEAPFEYYITFVQLRCPDAFISNNSIFYDDRNMNKMKSGGGGNKISILMVLFILLISIF